MWTKRFPILGCRSQRPPVQLPWQALCLRTVRAKSRLLKTANLCLANLSHIPKAISPCFKAPCLVFLLLVFLLPFSLASSGSVSWRMREKRKASMAWIRETQQEFRQRDYGAPALNTDSLWVLETSTFQRGKEHFLTSGFSRR